MDDSPLWQCVAWGGEGHQLCVGGAQRDAQRVQLGLQHSMGSSKVLQLYRHELDEEARCMAGGEKGREGRGSLPSTISLTVSAEKQRAE